MIEKNNNIYSLKTRDGELVSYIFEWEELMHQKGSLGRGNTDIEMFPIVGPTKQNDYRVKTPQGEAILDQHGLLREMEYHLIQETSDTVSFQKKYRAETKIINSKYPNRSTVKNLSRPYNFTVKKIFKLTEYSLDITFEVSSPEWMPFMFGYHPAFKLWGFLTESVLIWDNKITLAEVQKVWWDAYPLLNINEVILNKSQNESVKNQKNIKISTQGFENIMLRSEVPNMICIEPITNYPSPQAKQHPEEYMKISSGKENFSVKIQSISL